MRSATLLLLACGLAGLSSPTLAAGPSLSLSGEASVVSDYRFRGLSLSDRDPAVQGGLTAEHDSGFYAGLWGSTIAESEGGARGEIDWIGGYSAPLSAHVSLDMNVTWYTYPSDSALDYVEAATTLSYALGSSTPQLGLSYVPAQDATRDEAGTAHDNLYAFAGVEQAIGGTPVTLHGRIGYETGAFDLGDAGGKWDWEAGARLEVGGFTLGLSYVDSDARSADDRGRNLAGRTLLASITLSH